MSEQRLQFEIVVYYHNTHKEYRGLLFEVNNSTDKGASRKGQGLIKGAADLVMCAPNGRFIGFEVKAPGSRHNVAHVREQLEWAENVVKNGGLSFFITTLADFKDIVKILLGLDPIHDYGALNHICTMGLQGVRNLVEDAEKRNVKTLKF